MTAMERRKVLDSVAGVTSYDDEILKPRDKKGKLRIISRELLWSKESKKTS